MGDIGGYIVMWHEVKQYKRRGLFNRLLGKTIQRLQPVLHRYEDEEVAEYGFSNIKNNGGYRPYLLKIIKE